jgi:hypothetical protein
MALNLGFNYSQLQNEDKESSADVKVWEVRRTYLDLCNWGKPKEAASRLGLTDGAQPILLKQLKFDTKIWNTYVQLLEKAQSRNMLKLLYSGCSFLIFKWLISGTIFIFTLKSTIYFKFLYCNICIQSKGYLIHYRSN